jgi:hypothetical protein
VEGDERGRKVVGEVVVVFGGKNADVGKGEGIGGGSDGEGMEGRASWEQPTRKVGEEGRFVVERDDEAEVGEVREQVERRGSGEAEVEVEVRDGRLDGEEDGVERETGFLAPVGDPQGGYEKVGEDGQADASRASIRPRYNLETPELGLRSSSKRRPSDSDWRDL